MCVSALLSYRKLRFHTIINAPRGCVLGARVDGCRSNRASARECALAHSFFVGYNAGGENGCPSVPLLPPVLHCPFRRKKVKGGLRPFFYLLYSLIGKPKLILQIKNKPLTVSLLHFQSRPRGSKLHYILGRIYARIYPLDIGCLSCYNMCSGYIASSLKCYHFRTCEGGKPPFNPPFKRAGRLII